MPLSRVKAFVASSDVLASAHSFVTPAPLMRHGPFLGYYLGSGRRFHFDPPQLMLNGDTDSLVASIYGNKNSGKSTLMKSLAVSVCSTQSGLPNDPSGCDMPYSRMRSNDRKVNLEAADFEGPLRGEFAPLMDYLVGETVSLANHGRINPFDRQVFSAISELAEVAHLLAIGVTGRDLDIYEMTAISVAMHVMATEGKVTLERLVPILAAPSRSDVEAYVKSVEFGEGRDNIAILTDDQLFHTYCDASSRMAFAFKELMGGVYGELFGGERSLYEVLAKDIVNLDWTGVPDKGSDLLETLVYKMQSTAMRKKLPITVDIMINDEEGTRIKSLAHGLSFGQYVREARAFRTFSVQATQFSTDMDNLEGPLRKIGREIDAGTDIRIYGRQSADGETLESITRNRVTMEDALQTTILPRSCWGIKVKNRPMQFIQHIVPPSLLEVIETNRANKLAAARINTASLPYYAARAEKISRTWSYLTSEIRKGHFDHDAMTTYMDNQIGDTHGPDATGDEQG